MPELRGHPLLPRPVFRHLLLRQLVFRHLCQEVFPDLVEDLLTQLTQLM
jgi:hypothetical protein